LTQEISNMNKINTMTSNNNNSMSKKNMRDLILRDKDQKPIRNSR